jgi:lipopolysaccharide biosynthesis regulator YciM
MTVYWWIAIIAVLFALAAGGAYYYRRSVKREQSSPDESYVEALRALLDGNSTLAFLKLKETVTHDSGNIDAYLRLGLLLRQRGMYSRSLQLSADLNSRQTVSEADRARIMYNLAEDYEVTGKLEAAERVLKQLSQMSGQKATASKRLVRLYERLERWEDAFEAGSDYLEATKDRDRSSLAKYKLRLGDRLVKGGDFHKARTEYKDALKLEPACAEAVVGIGDAYEKEGRLEDAAKAWRRIIGVNPKKAELVFARLQKVLFDLGQFGEIEDLYNQVLESDKENLGALTGLASLSEKKGDRVQAEALYLQILEARPDYRPALVGLLRLYYEQNKFTEAARVIDRTVETLVPVDKS